MFTARWLRRHGSSDAVATQRALRTVNNEVRTGFVAQFKRQLQERRQEVELANKDDCEALAGDLETTEDESLMQVAERMYLDVGKWDKLMKDLDEIEISRDHTGSLRGEWETENKVSARKTRAPYGRVLYVHGADVDNTARAIAMLIKCGNVASVKGSSRTPHTNNAILKCAAAALDAVGLPDSCAELVVPPEGVTPHDHLSATLAAVDHDLVIAAGPRALQDKIRATARAPVMHLGPLTTSMYIHKDAEPVQVVRVVRNAKAQSMAATALDHILLNADYVKKTELFDMLREEGIKVHGDKAVRKLVSGCEELKKADWGKEWLDKRVGVRQVQAFEQAVEQINEYSSGHLDVIMTRREDLSLEFQERCDSAVVLTNTSTRLGDSEGLAMGPGLGIAAGCFHRGPVAMTDLMTTQFKVVSVGRTRPETNSRANPVIAYGKMSAI